MMEIQPDHEHMAALLELMRATNKVADPRALAERALDWLMARGRVVSAGIWLDQSGDLICLVRRNLDLDTVEPLIRQVLESSEPQTLVYQQDLRLTILPMGTTAARGGALAMAMHAPPDPDELLLLRVVAAHLATIMIARPIANQSQASGPSDREWEVFLGHAAHEIKNPLASIKGYSDLLLRRAAKDPADLYHKGLSTISQQVVRTTGLLDQLSDITRLGAGALQIDRHEADFVQIVDQVVQDYQAADPQHELTFNTEATRLLGRFDQGRIAQVVGALISNALKFSFDGGVVSVLLRRSYADDGKTMARLAVNDTGIGVPEGEQERVFERFYRGSNVRGTYAGLGVGLYIARAIVGMHGGRIWLESKPGLQTTCHVALPLVA